MTEKPHDLRYNELYMWDPKNDTFSKNNREIFCSGRHYASQELGWETVEHGTWEQEEYSWIYGVKKEMDEYK